MLNHLANILAEIFYYKGLSKSSDTFFLMSYVSHNNNILLLKDLKV